MLVLICQNPEVYMFLTTCERAGFYLKSELAFGFLFGWKVDNMFQRLLTIINEGDFKKIQNTSILLVGVGGVGGYSLEALIRSGFLNITIIDGDIIDITNLNRQIIATNENIGLSKVLEAKKRALNINGMANIKTVNTYLTKDNFDTYINEKYDFIIDACDDIDIKIELIKYARKNDINIICALGTGRKIKPELLKISTLNKTFNDPLAKKLRHELRKENMDLNIPVVFSEEEAINTNNEVGSMVFVPAVAGIYLANYVLRKTIEK